MAGHLPRQQYANQVGAYGWGLLQALQATSTPEWMQTLPAVTTLRTIWEQQFEPVEQGGQWRQEPLLPAAQLITSPHDLDARNGKKRSTFWTGYKVHFTQTCDEDAPQLITPAPASDEGVLSASTLIWPRRSYFQISISLIQAIRRSRIW